MEHLELDLPSEASLGAIDGDGGLFAVGLYDGGAACFDARTLARTDVPPMFGGQCLGVRVVPDGLVLLGSEISISHESPRNWDESLVLVERGSWRERQRTELGPGNWRLARGAVGVLFDSTENQGCLAIDARTGERLWARPGGSFRKFEAHGGLLYGLREDGVEVVDAGGELVERVRWPDDRYAITSVLPHENGWICGGYERATRSTVLLRWSRGFDLLASTRAEEQFDARTLANARSCEDSCGYDLHVVANLAWIRPGKELLVVLGGGGEGALSACQGACAVGVVDLAAPAFVTELVDSEHGSSGLVALPDGRFLLDSEGTVRLLRGPFNAAART